MTAPKPQVLPNLSPTTYNKFQRCQRIVWFEKVAGKKPAPTKSLVVGVGVHAVVEQYLLTGEWVDKVAGGIDCTRIAAAGKDILDDLRTLMELDPDAYHVELTHRLPAGDLGPLPVKCQADFVGPALVVDHKTTSNLYGPWHKTADELAADPQMLFYAYLSLRDDPPEQFTVQHVYYATKGRPAARVLAAETTWGAAVENRDRFVTAAQGILELTAVTDVQDVPGNSDACSGFGGCPHSPYCPVRKHVTRGSNPMSFAERMKKIRAAKAAEAMPALPPEVGAIEPTMGQMNPPDTPGTETPTKAQYDDVAQAAMDAVGFGADDETIAKWLSGPAGIDTLLRSGLTLRDSLNVVKYINDDFSPEDQAAATPADDTSSPSEPEASAIPRDGAAAELPDSSGLLPPRDPALDEVERLQTAFEQYLLANTGPASKKDLLPIVREVLDVKRVGSRIWGQKVFGENGVLRLGSDRGIWDYSANDAAVVWLRGTLPPEPGEAAPEETEQLQFIPHQPETEQFKKDTAAAQELVGRVGVRRITADKNPLAAPKTVGAGSGLAQPVSPTTPVAPTSTPSTIILIGCLPQQAAPLVRLDDVLAPYYDAVAKDENVADYTLVEYGKGPPMVAAQALSDVREGRLKYPTGFLSVPADHPLATRVDRIWPDAIVIRGVR